MKNQSSFPFIAIAAISAIVALTGCNKPAETVETQSQASTTTAQGKVQTNSESTQVGNTMEAKAVTENKTADGTATVKTETFVGTVTVYEAGKKIEVLTGEKTRHSVELEGKDVQVNVVGTVAVGSHVRLVQEKDDKGTRVSVTVEGAS